MKQLPRIVTFFFLVAAPAAVLVAAELITFRNSPTLNEVISLNDRGMILGRREVMHVPGALSMESYVRVDGIDQPVPIPAEFTHVEPQVITDSGHVVGFVTRPPGNPEGSLRAFVWAVDQAAVELLPLPEGFGASCATDGSLDAKRVSGHVLGSNPPRLQPCLWQRQPSGWSCQLLPVTESYNPMLSSARTMISDNGEIVAASLVTSRSPQGLLAYGLFRWQRDETGQWQSEVVFNQPVHLGDVNDQGMIVGRVLHQGRRCAFVYDPIEGPRALALPAGRASAYATDVNRHGEVVGVCEDPTGPDGTTSAFLWFQGQLTDLPFGVEVAASTANAITDQRRIGGMLVRVSPVADSNTTARDAQVNSVPDDIAVEAYVLRIESPNP